MACSWLQAPVWTEERNTGLCRKVASLVDLSIVKIGRDFWWSSGPTLLKQGYPRALGTGLCCDSIWISPRLETPLPPWATSVSAWALRGKKCSWMFRENCLCFRLCLSLWSCHWEPLKEPGSDLPPCRYLYPLMRSPWTFLSPADQSQLSQPLLIGGMPWSSFFVLVASHCSLSSMSIFFLYWRMQNRTQYPRCGLTSAD